MSELILLVARGPRWAEGCRRLVRECRLYSLFQQSPRCKVGEPWSKPLCPVPVATWTISQQPTWWNSLRGISPHPLKRHVFASVVPSAEVRGAASVVPERESSAAREDVYNVEHKTHDIAQASLYLQRLFGITAEEADFCVNNHQGFSITDPADIPHNYEASRAAGFSDTAIRQNLWILSHPHKIVKTKIEYITNMNIAPIDDAIPFFNLNPLSLRSFSSQLNYEAIKMSGDNRITYMAKRLQCPTLAICQVMAKHLFMRTMLLSKLEQVLEIMLGFQVTTDDILNDVWAFRYNPRIITERLKIVTEAGVYPLKPWMIRCSERTLSRTIEKELRRRSVLGDRGTIIEYLSHRFKCDEKTIIAFFEKDRRIAQVSGPKMKRMVDFLLENGYTVVDLMRSPRVLFCSSESLQERLLELQKYQHKPESLAVFCKTKRQYNDYLKVIQERWHTAITR